MTFEGCGVFITMSANTDAGEAAERLAVALEAAGLPYAIGGALAMGVHGHPRGTLDTGAARRDARKEVARPAAAPSRVGRREQCADRGRGVGGSFAAIELRTN